MFALQFNTLLKLSFANRVRQDRGFACLLTAADRPHLESKTAEVSRFCRLTERNYRATLREAANKIQRSSRVYLLKARLRNLSTRIIKDRLDKAATLIQTHIRRCLALKRASLKRVVEGLLKVRTAAAKSIQRLFYSKVLARKAHYLSILSQLYRIRQSASIEIQRVVKGFLVRKDLAFVKQLHLMIRWPYNSKDAHVIGTITQRPWRDQVKMEYSRYLKEFYSPYARDYALPKGIYYIKFIVEGQWICDGNLPITQDESGNFNNVFIVVEPSPPVRSSSNLRKDVKRSIAVDDKKPATERRVSFALQSKAKLEIRDGLESNGRVGGQRSGSTGKAKETSAVFQAASKTMASRSLELISDKPTQHTEVKPSVKATNGARPTHPRFMLSQSELGPSPSPSSSRPNITEGFSKLRNQAEKDSRLLPRELAKPRATVEAIEHIKTDDDFMSRLKAAMSQEPSARSPKPSAYVSQL